MKNLTHRGYQAAVAFEADSDVFVGRIAGISDIITFEADSVEELKTAFIDAVDDYLAHCEKIGKRPQKSYSGKFIVRLPPELHAKIANAAELNHMSLNDFARSVLDKAVS